MVYASVFFVVQLLFGFLIFGFFDPKKRFQILERIAASVVVGLLSSSFLILLLALTTKSLLTAIFIFFVLFLLTFVSLLIVRIKAIKIYFFFIIKQLKLLICQRKIWLFLLIAILLIYSYYLSIILFRNSEGNIRATMPGWGDSAFHLDTIERFAAAQPFNLDHPVFSGSKLTYPFLINFISAIFRGLGADLVFAYRLPLFIFGLSALILIFVFASRILKSKNFAILALILILLGSGLGFLTLFKDLSSSYQSEGVSGLYNFIKNPAHEYTHFDNRTGGKADEKDTADNIVWIVPIVSFLSHQRSFALGLAIFSLILLGIYYYGKERYFWRYGLLAGLLPFSHSHSFLALFFLLATLFWFYRCYWKPWLVFALLTSIIALPQIAYFSSNSKLISESLFRPWFGWMACGHSISWFFCDPSSGTDSNAFIFWSKNFGVVFWIWLIVLVFISLSFFFPKIINKIKPPHQKFSGGGKGKFNLKFILASLALFLMPNLFLFQPWDFDNGKILFYWWVLAIIFCVGPFLKILWEKNFVAKALVVLLVFFGILAGAFDFSHRLFFDKKLNSFGYADSDENKVIAAQWIKENSAPNALFLTSTAIDPIPTFLAGRRSYLGYEGWLWTQGLDYRRNKKAAGEILAGDLEKACQERIDFILLDNELKKDYPETSEEAILEKTKVVFSQTTPYGERKLLRTICDDTKQN